MKRSSRWKPIAAALVVGAAASISYLSLAEKQYEGTAKLQVVPLLPGDRTFAGFSLPRGSSGSTTPADTVADLVETPSVVDAAATSLRLARDDVFDAVSVETEGASNIVSVRARTDDSRRAAQLANAIATAFVSQRSGVFQADLNRTISQLREELRNVPASRRDEPPASAVVERLDVLRTFAGQRDPTVSVAAEAVARESAVWPRPLPVLAAALGASLLLGLLFGAVSRFAARHRAPVSPSPPATPTRDAASLAQRAEQLAERIRAVTDRELAVARAAALQSVRERERDEADAARREREEALARRLRDLDQARREPEPEPEPVVKTGALGPSNVFMLERLVEQHGNEHPGRVDEWNTYLFALREHADAGGALPSSFDTLVVEVFGELLERER